MKLEDLYKKLRENDEIGKCCLAAIIENQCKRMEREELEGKGKTVCYIQGCLEALCALGEITEDEECMIWKEIMLRAYGETTL